MKMKIKEQGCRYAQAEHKSLHESLVPFILSLSNRLVKEEKE